MGHEPAGRGTERETLYSPVFYFHYVIRGKNTKSPVFPLKENTSVAEALIAL